MGRHSNSDIRSQMEESLSPECRLSTELQTRIDGAMDEVRRPSGLKKGKFTVGNHVATVYKDGSIGYELNAVKRAK